ncbi:hypothetical protein QE152_g5026 [Popillia japonica]|uniref:Uncharacterized protein n=1 Tax=Popillia japonica TaxID=7064 RepID=A0AAW1MXR9_POPJA
MAVSRSGINGTNPLSRISSCNEFGGWVFDAGGGDDSAEQIKEGIGNMGGGEGTRHRIHGLRISKDVVRMQISE